MPHKCWSILEYLLIQLLFIRSRRPEKTELVQAVPALESKPEPAPCIPPQEAQSNVEKEVKQITLKFQIWLKICIFVNQKS